MSNPTPKQFAERLINLYGGTEKAREVLDRRHAAFNMVWAQNIDKIGRVVRAHLVVEHFMTVYLAARNPLLGQMEDARLTFSQKATLLGKSDSLIACLAPGIRRLNAIRNRLAHNLNAELTTEDAEVFLTVDPFKALRQALSGKSVATGSPIDVLEDFTKHAAVWFDHGSSPDATLWQQALKPDDYERD
jgi:hypothetical protein